VVRVARVVRVGWVRSRAVAGGAAHRKLSSSTLAAMRTPRSEPGGGSSLAAARHQWKPLTVGTPASVAFSSHKMSPCCFSSASRVSSCRRVTPTLPIRKQTSTPAPFSHRFQEARTPSRRPRWAGPVCTPTSIQMPAAVREAALPEHDACPLTAGRGDGWVEQTSGIVS